MIKIVKRNIFDSDCTIVAHPTNCFSRMNYGVAKQFKKHYPEAHRTDLDFRLEREKRLGDCSFVYSEKNNKIIFNLYSRYEEEGNTNEEMLEKSLEKMFIIVDKLEEKGYKVKIGLPYNMGCGVEDGRGNWNKIENIIKKLSDRYNRIVYLYS